eukprot:TRINITY_DN11234_c0_g1_i3.p1 TRINITY_DN11234_c0_g1~~TRINITY_DN11234_c0_g1_i3.p1  ORF type:complete len:383 (-),score=45.89 TRINITY_DN11234_c0_g1_i3:53-1201(-)
MQSFTVRMIREKDIASQRSALERMGSDLKLKRVQDWYNVHVLDFIKQRGAWGLIKVHGSMHDAIITLYPEYEWKRQLFVARNYKKKIVGPTFTLVEQRRFVDAVGRKLGIKQWRDWYKITVEDMAQHGSFSVLRHYQNSIHNTMVNVYPEHPWQMFLFQKAPNGYWKNPDNQRLMFDHMWEKLGIKQFEDWYTIEKKSLPELAAILTYHDHSLPKALSAVYPEFPWDHATYSRSNSSKLEKRVFHLLQELFPDKDIHINFLDPDLEFLATSQKVTLDLFIPSLKLGFEVNGIFHYTESSFHLTRLANMHESTQLRDKEKLEAFRSKGITVIEIPFWFDGRKSSLAATISKHCPELIAKLDEHATPVPSTFTFNKQVFRLRDS